MWLNSIQEGKQQRNYVANETNENKYENKKVPKLRTKRKKKNNSFHGI